MTHRPVIPHQVLHTDSEDSLVAGPGTSESKDSCGKAPATGKKLTQFHPPNEFDWFSSDKMGKIITMNDACELFSIMKMSGCTYTLQELMMNARRQHFWSCPAEQMPIITDALSQMKCLSKLILRGMADNHMMKLIGQNIPGLKHLDVSFSQYVTDEGILKLFFDDVKEKSAFYLIPSWIQKNLHRMWPLAHNLEYLDFSWTAVTSQSRKMVNLIPGSYMFKRMLAVTESEGYAQHIFVRRPVRLTFDIYQNICEYIIFVAFNSIQ